jgi:general stress protein 26
LVEPNAGKEDGVDSINRNQPEETREHLRGAAAIRKIKELVEEARTCFFCTAAATGESGGTRPMSVQKVDDEGGLWFFSASDSRKNQEIAIDPRVRLFFQGSAHAGFLRLDGTATISTDRATIRELWNPLAKVWFTGGVDDPRITLIKVSPQGGYYWDTKHGQPVAGIKMLLGVVLGKTLDDSIEGTVSVHRA